MHNNFTVDKTPKAPKAFYTVTETAVLWARSEGARGAGDPRIAHYSGLILQAIKDGNLKASGEDSPAPVIAFADLKEWFRKDNKDAHPKFLFGND